MSHLSPVPKPPPPPPHTHTHTHTHTNTRTHAHSQAKRMPIPRFLWRSLKELWEQSAKEAAASAGELPLVLLAHTKTHTHTHTHTHTLYGIYMCTLLSCLLHHLCVGTKDELQKQELQRQQQQQQEDGVTEVMDLTKDDAAPPEGAMQDQGTDAGAHAGGAGAADGGIHGANGGATGRPSRVASRRAAAAAAAAVSNNAPTAAEGDDHVMQECGLPTETAGTSAAGPRALGDAQQQQQQQRHLQGNGCPVVSCLEFPSLYSKVMAACACACVCVCKESVW